VNTAIMTQAVEMLLFSIVARDLIIAHQISRDIPSSSMTFPFPYLSSCVAISGIPSEIDCALSNPAINKILEAKPHSD